MMIIVGISSDDLRGFLNAISTYEWWHLMLTQSSEKDPSHLHSCALIEQRTEIWIIFQQMGGTL